MKPYMVSYDLIKRKDYPELWNALKAYPTHLHLLGSTWIVKSDNTASSICKALMAHIDGDDKIIVTEIVGANSTWTTSFPDTVRAWLKKHLWGL